MSRFSGRYSGRLRTETEHLASGQKIMTDAPTDNHGLGETFSPTDLLATALGTCMMTVMGIKAQSMNISLDNSSFEIEKVMAAHPRRVSGIKVKLHLPGNIRPEDRKILEETGLNCPVARSLHADLEQDIHFEYHT